MYPPGYITWKTQHLCAKAYRLPIRNLSGQLCNTVRSWIQFRVAVQLSQAWSLRHKQALAAWTRSQTRPELASVKPRLLFYWPTRTSKQNGAFDRDQAEFIDPWLGDRVDSDTGLSHWPASPCSLAAGTTTLCRSWLYPPVRIYEFGYSGLNWPRSGHCRLLNRDPRSSSRDWGERQILNTTRRGGKVCFKLNILLILAKFKHIHI